MKPKTEIRFSWIYNKKFNKEITVPEFIKLKTDCRDFIELYNQYIDKILNLIGKNNASWKREYLPIYVVDAEIKSFSDPLTIRYRNNPKLMLLILIHELIHNNLTKKYKKPSIAHQIINNVYDRVIDELELKGFEKARELYAKFSH